MIFDKAPQSSTWFSEILHSSPGSQRFYRVQKSYLQFGRVRYAWGSIGVHKVFIQVAMRCLKLGPDE